jgi:opacity protein-like surface antigen
MKTVLFGAVSALMLASAAFASPAGQVFEVTGPETAFTIALGAEGGYVITAGETETVGTWTLEDGVLCLIAADIEEPNCGTWTDLEVGETNVTAEWSQDGVEVTILRVE